MNYLDHPSVQKVKDKAYAKSVVDKRKRTEQRAITVMKNGKVVCTVCVQVMEFAPLIQTPSEVIKSKKFLEPTINTNQFDGYEFTEYVPAYSNDVDNNFVAFESEYNLATDEDVKNMKEYVNDNLGGKPRYYAFCTVTNPLTHTTYTFFVDRFHKDIFYVSGLDLYINDDILPDPLSSIVVAGTKAGGMPQTTTNGLEDNMTISHRLSTKHNTFSIPKLVDEKANFPVAGVKASAVTFTGDLPGTTKSGNYPVFYDRLEHINGKEIQIARQDTIPFLWLELGTFAELNSGEQGVVPNFLPYNYKGNTYRLKYNGTHYNEKAKLAIVIPIW